MIYYYSKLYFSLHLVVIPCSMNLHAYSYSAVLKTNTCFPFEIAQVSPDTLPLYRSADNQKNKIKKM